MTRARDIANLGNNTTNLETIDTVYSAGGLTGRNLIINGAMTVAQRGTQTGQTGSIYTACDRFITSESGAAVTTSSQDTDVPSGQGFANSLKIDVTTADASLASTDYFLIIQRLEGQDLQHLLYGTSGAKDLTISFWVKSPKTGTHILELRHNDATYYNSQAYTITSANTWQKVELTFSGYTVTGFDNDNAHSLSVNWWLMSGSDFTSGTLNSNTWHNTAANRAVGQVNCVDDAANNFYITGVQLEVGETATPFEHEDYGTTLRKCQRYYYQTTDYIRYMSQGPVSTQAWEWIDLPVTMRAQPTGTVYGSAGEGDVGKAAQDGGDKETLSLYQSPFVLGLLCSNSTSGQNLQFWKIKVDAEL